LTIELTPAQGAESLRSCSEIIYIIRLRMTRYAHALSSHTPKDTLLTLNTCIRRISAALQCARPCNCVILLRIPSVALRLPVRGCALDAHYPINFVVKHPNLSVLPVRLALRRLKPAACAACFQIGVTLVEWRRLGNSE